MVYGISPRDLLRPWVGFYKNAELGGISIFLELEFHRIYDRRCAVSVLCSVFGVRCSVSGVSAVFGVRCSVSVRCSVFGVRRPVAAICFFSICISGPEQRCS